MMMNYDKVQKIYPVMMGYLQIQDLLDTEIRRRFIFGFAHVTLGLVNSAGRPISCNPDAKRLAEYGQLSIPHFMSDDAKTVWYTKRAVIVEHSYPVKKFTEDLMDTNNCEEAMQIVHDKYRLGFITHDEHMMIGDAQSSIGSEPLNIYQESGIKGNIINGNDDTARLTEINSKLDAA